MKAALGPVLLLSCLLAGAAAVPAQEPAPETVTRLGFSVDPGLPLEIGAEELEFKTGANGEERIEFRRAVEVVQGTLRMRGDRVEAVYPDGTGGRPSQIVATGQVQISQEGVEARCGQVTFDGRCSVVCRATSEAATLRRGEDVLRGHEIHFDLCKGTLKAKGRTRVEIHPKPKTGEPER